MAKPKWQVKLQAKLDATPLFIMDPPVIGVRCLTCKGDDRGKKLTLREVVNYNWKTCAGCKLTVN